MFIPEQCRASCESLVFALIKRRRETIFPLLNNQFQSISIYIFNFAHASPVRVSVLRSDKVTLTLSHRRKLIAGNVPHHFSTLGKEMAEQKSPIHIALFLCNFTRMESQACYLNTAAACCCYPNVLWLFLYICTHAFTHTHTQTKGGNHSAVLSSSLSLESAPHHKMHCGKAAPTPFPFPSPLFSHQY